MHASPSRNAPCPCGSGKKYKRCCATGRQPTASAVNDQLQRVTRLYQQGQLQEANQLAEQLLLSEPGNNMLLEISAATALQTGNLQLAVERFSQQAANQPENALAHSNLCMALHMSGQDDAAFQHGQQAILLDPQLADAWNNLGNIYETGNKLIKAREHYEKSLSLDNSDPRIHLNAGAIALKLGDYDNAESHFQQVLSKQPDYALAHNSLGATLVKQGRYRDADDSYRQALQLQPDNPEFLVNYAVLLLAQNEPDKARKLLDKAITLNPDHIGAYITLGNLSESLNDSDAVARYYDKALLLDPDNSIVLCNLGYREFELGNQNAAIDYFLRAQTSNPHSAKTLAGLGKAMLRQDKVDEAAAYIDEALSLSPLEVHTHIANALLHERLHDFNKAEAEWEFAVAQHPEMSNAYIGLATLHAANGNTTQARKQYLAAEAAGANNALLYHFWSAMEEKLHHLDTAAALAEKALEQDPAYPGLALIQARLARRNKDYTAALAYLDRIDSGSIQNRLSQANYQFERGDIQDRLQNYTAAFIAYDKANQAKNLFIGSGYDAEVDKSRFRHLQQFFSKETIQTLSRLSPEASANTPSPVFIIGFPRSGTSLLEQILGSHAQIEAAGELTYINDLTERKAAELLESELPFPDLLLDQSVALDADKVTRLRNFYLGKVASLEIANNSTRWITDKMPHNTLHAGLLKLLFPHSPIIHITRHPLNACLSAYFANFNSGHRYTSSLVSTARHYQNVMDMVLHYRTNGIPMLEVRYEDLVTDQRATVLKVLEYIGADWDDACLQHHKSDRVVKTVSYEQVTQKVYTSSLYRYRNYREAVEAVIPILQATIDRFGYNTE